MFPHLIDEENEAQGLTNLLKDIQQSGADRDGIQTTLACQFLGGGRKRLWL